MGQIGVASMTNGTSSNGSHFEAALPFFTTLGLTTRRDDDSTAATDNDFDAHIPWVTAIILVYVVGAGADYDYGYDYGYGYYLCRW